MPWWRLGASVDQVPLSRGPNNGQRSLGQPMQRLQSRQGSALLMPRSISQLDAGPSLACCYFSIDGGESSARKQPHPSYRRVGGVNHFAQRTYPALDLRVVNLSEVFFLTSIQSIGIAMGPETRAGFIGALNQSS